MGIRKKLVDIVCQSETFLILTHVRPDGDAISSSIAMYYFLVSLGKNPQDIDVFIPHVSKDLSFVDNENILKSNCSIKKYDLVIILDCSEYSRVEGIDLLNEFPTQNCIVFDHHESSGSRIESDYSIIDTGASSCTCVIYRELFDYISEQNVNYFLKCIAVGILSDTIGLTLNVTDECKSILNYCTEKSIDIQSIKDELQSVDERTQTLTDLAINRFNIKQGIGCTYILQEDLLPGERSLKTVNHKSIIEKILHLNDCNTLILLIENDNHEFKGSLRTTLSDINLNDICELMVQSNYFLQGGGHANSAGFRVAISNNLMECLNCIFELLIETILSN